MSADEYAEIMKRKFCPVCRTMLFLKDKTPYCKKCNRFIISISEFAGAEERSQEWQKKLIQEEVELEKRLHRLKEVEAEERQAELDRNRRKEELMQHERGVLLQARGDRAAGATMRKLNRGKRQLAKEKKDAAERQKQLDTASARLIRKKYGMWCPLCHKTMLSLVDNKNYCKKCKKFITE